MENHHWSEKEYCPRRSITLPKVLQLVEDENPLPKHAWDFFIPILFISGE
jgi:hypothetical protein